MHWSGKLVCPAGLAERSCTDIITKKSWIDIVGNQYNKFASTTGRVFFVPRGFLSTAVLEDAQSRKTPCRIASLELSTMVDCSGLHCWDCVFCSEECDPKCITQKEFEEFVSTQSSHIDKKPVVSPTITIISPPVSDTFTRYLEQRKNRRDHSGDQYTVDWLGEQLESALVFKIKEMEVALERIASYEPASYDTDHGETACWSMSCDRCCELIEIAKNALKGSDHE